MVGWRLERGPLMAVALAVALSAGATASFAQTQPQIDPALRDAALRQMKTPQGVGGCIFLAVAVDIRRAALVDAMSGQPPQAAFQTAVAEVAPKCASRPYSRSDTAVVGATISTLNISAAALELAADAGIGQETLDRAWTTAPAGEKTAYYTLADQFLVLNTPVTGPPPVVSLLAARAGLTLAQAARNEVKLRRYFINTALSEKAEAALAKPRS